MKMAKRDRRKIRELSTALALDEEAITDLETRLTEQAAWLTCLVNLWNEKFGDEPPAQPIHTRAGYPSPDAMFDGLERRAEG